MPPEFKTIHLHKVKVSPTTLFDKVRNHAAPILTKFIFGYVILLIILNFVPYFISLFAPTTVADVAAYLRPDIQKEVLKQLPAVPISCYIFAFLFNGMFSLGEALYCLTCLRNRRVEFSALFEGIRFYFKALGLFICKGIIISVGIICFIIPGIVYAFNFSQAYYILADNPEKSIFACLAESKLRMTGNRITYLISLLVFILIAFFTYVTTVFLSDYINVDILTFEGICLYITVSVPFYAGMGLLELGKCTFYELLLEGDFTKFKYKGESVFREAVSDSQNDNDERGLF